MCNLKPNKKGRNIEKIDWKKSYKMEKSYVYTIMKKAPINRYCDPIRDYRKSPTVGKCWCAD